MCVLSYIWEKRYIYIYAYVFICTCIIYVYMPLSYICMYFSFSHIIYDTYSHLWVRLLKILIFVKNEIFWKKKFEKVPTIIFILNFFEKKWKNLQKCDFWIFLKNFFKKNSLFEIFAIFQKKKSSKWIW